MVYLQTTYELCFGETYFVYFAYDVKNMTSTFSVQLVDSFLFS